MRLWYKMLRLLKNYAPSFLVTSLAGIFTWFIATVVTLTHGASKTVITIVKYVAPSVAAGFSAGIGQGLMTLAWNVVWSLQWFAKHIYEIMAGGVAASFFTYKEYGEEASFPIFAFWSLVLAYALVFISKTLEYTSRVKKYVDSVRSYIPIGN